MFVCYVVLFNQLVFVSYTLCLCKVIVLSVDGRFFIVCWSWLLVAVFILHKILSEVLSWWLSHTARCRRNALLGPPGELITVISNTAGWIVQELCWMANGDIPGRGNSWRALRFPSRAPQEMFHQNGESILCPSMIDSYKVMNQPKVGAHLLLLLLLRRDWRPIVLSAMLRG